MGLIVFTSDYTSFKDVSSRIMQIDKADIFVNPAAYRLFSVSSDTVHSVATVALTSSGFPSTGTLDTDFPNAITITNTLYIGQGVSVG